MKSPRSAFTLIELLIVIVIITVLLVITATRLGHNLALQLTTAGDRISMLAQQARQVAKTNQSFTALIIVTSSGKTEFDYRALTLLELSPEATDWKQIASWERLPATVIIDPDATTSFGNSPTPAIALPSLHSPGGTLPPTAYIYQIFRPNGQLLQNTSAPSLRLIPEHRKGSNFVRIVISPSTGTVHIERPSSSTASSPPSP